MIPSELSAAARISGAWRALDARVAAACAAAGRSPSEVTVLAAVKTRTPTEVLAALAAGCRVIGQNRAQELTAVSPALAELWRGPLQTHFIGGLQTNKVNQVLRWADAVQSVDRWDLAERLSVAAVRRVDGGGSPLGVFVQVNASGEATKGGVTPAEAVAFAWRVAELDGLRLRGFMTIGANSPDAAEVAASLAVLPQLREELLAGPGGAGVDGATELSMGMTADLEAAIAAGSTMVRVGSAIFGPRLPA